MKEGNDKMIKELTIEYGVGNLKEKVVATGKFSTQDALKFIKEVEEGSGVELSSVQDAINFMREEMIKDNSEAKGSYAHSWHCNIAMMCFDAIGKELPDLDFETSHKIGNDAATRFMKLCFDVDTKA